MKAKYKKGDIVKYLGWVAKIRGTHEDIASGRTQYHIEYRKWINDDKMILLSVNFVNESDLKDK